jgi:hypothetical protein
MTRGMTYRTTSQSVPAGSKPRNYRDSDPIWFARTALLGKEGFAKEYQMKSYLTEASADSERRADLDFAGQAVVYLEKSGFGVDEVVACLVDEFDLDLDTARELAALAA